MASNISTTGLNAAYPVAGQDNDSQGFRDNFTNVKTNLETAATEITTLQSTAAKLNSANDFNGNNISEANFIANTEEVYGPVTKNDTTTNNINFTDGHYQLITVDASSTDDTVTLTLAAWPATGKYARIRVGLVRGGSTNQTVSFAASGGGTVKTDGNAAWTGDSLIIGANKTFVDFFTDDAGLVVYASYIGTFS